MKQVLKIIKTFLPYVFIVGALITLCLSGDYFNLLELKDAPRLISGELLAVIITASVTALLLNNQSERELKKERFAVVFKKKAETYEKYLDKLYKIAEKRTITKEQVKVLIDKLNFNLGMYLEKGELDQINQSIINMWNECNGKTPDPQKFLNYAEEILKVLRDDLKEGEWRI